MLCFETKPPISLFSGRFRSQETPKATFPPPKCRDFERLLNAAGFLQPLLHATASFRYVNIAVCLQQLHLISPAKCSRLEMLT